LFAGRNRSRLQEERPTRGLDEVRRKEASKKGNPQGKKTGTRSEDINEQGREKGKAPLRGKRKKKKKFPGRIVPEPLVKWRPSKKKKGGSPKGRPVQQKI